MEQMNNKMHYVDVSNFRFASSIGSTYDVINGLREFDIFNNDSCQLQKGDTIRYRYREIQTEEIWDAFYTITTVYTSTYIEKNYVIVGLKLLNKKRFDALVSDNQ